MTSFGAEKRKYGGPNVEVLWLRKPMISKDLGQYSRNVFSEILYLLKFLQCVLLSSNEDESKIFSCIYSTFQENKHAHLQRTLLCVVWVQTELIFS